MAKQTETPVDTPDQTCSHPNGPSPTAYVYFDDKPWVVFFCSDCDGYFVVRGTDLLVE